MTTLVALVGGAGGLFLLGRGMGDVWGGPYRGKDPQRRVSKNWDPALCPVPSLLVTPLVGPQFLLILLRRAAPELGSVAPVKPE